MINLVTHPLAKSCLVKIRNKKTDIKEYREYTRILTYCIALDATKDFPIKSVNVETPFEEIIAEKLDVDIILLPILRAGLSMVDSFLDLFPAARIGYVGVRRNEDTLEPEEYYFSLPPVKENSVIIILEPMIATGGTICQTLGKLQLEGIENVVITSILSAPEGIERILSEYPGISITTAALDRELNHKGYIIPGLGDAGDRYTGY
jgi:uracil phosphoribosyltransferase